MYEPTIESEEFDEHTCIECKNYFFTEVIPLLPADFELPSYCPFCGTKFTHIVEGAPGGADVV